MISPGASYTTYRNWIDYHGGDELLCPPHDTITYFDNIAKYVNKVIPSVNIITTTLHFKLDGQFQKRIDLKPSNWPKKDIRSKHLEMRKLVEFRQVHLSYINKMLETAKLDNDDVSKTILQLQKSSRHCIKESCGKVFDTLKKQI